MYDFELISLQNYSYVHMCILKNGAKVNKVDKNQGTALMAAAANGHYVTAELLIRRGSRVNLKRDDATTALILAAQGGYVNIVKLLVENNADVLWKNLQGLSALNAGISFMGNKFALQHVNTTLICATLPQQLLGKERDILKWCNTLSRTEPIWRQLMPMV